MAISLSTCGEVEGGGLLLLPLALLGHDRNADHTHTSHTSRPCVCMCVCVHTDSCTHVYLHHDRFAELLSVDNLDSCCLLCDTVDA